MAAFNLTAQLNLRGPSNIRNIVANIRRQVGSINGNINFNINPSTTRNIAQLNSTLQALNQTFAQTVTAANNAANAVSAFANAANAGNINNVATNINNVNAAANNTTQTVTRTARQVATARTEMEEFGRQSALAIRRFAAFSISTGAILSITNAVRKGVDAFIEYDRQLVKLQQVTGESAAGLSKLSGTITSLATGLGVASSDLIEVSSTLAQAGLSARDTERALKALALSALAPSFDNLNQTVEGSIALMRQFGISASDLESSLGSVNAVAAKFAVESSDIIAAIQRTGGVFASASKGVTEGKQALNEFIAVFTSVRATTRESAETIATGLRTIFTRIQRGGTIEALKEFGVNLTDVEGKFVGAYKAVQLLSEGLNRIDPRDLKFSQIVEELGGFRQIGKVIPLIQEFTTAQQALAVAQAGAGSLSVDAVKAQLSLANQISKVREEFLALFREIGQSDSFQTIAKGALDVASALIRVADSVKGVLPVLGIMLAMRGASAITQFGSGFIGGIRRGGGAAAFGSRAAGGFATGGYVPGKGNRDTVPAMLTPGEFVIRKKAVEKIGVGRLAALNRNQGGPIQYLNSGGVVQKFARGGIAQLSSISPGIGRSKIQTYIDDNKNTKQRKTPVQSNDIVSSNIVRIQLNKNNIGNLDNFRKNIENRTKSIQSNRGGTRFSVQGIAFENWLWDNIPLIRDRYRKAPTKNYPIDLIPKFGADPAEIKFTGEQVPDPLILNKRLRYNLLNNQLSGFTKYIDRNINFGRTIVYELAPGLKDEIFYPTGVSESTKQKRMERSTAQKNRLKAAGFNLRSLGGFIQKFIIGGGVKKPKIPTPQELLIGPGDKKTGWSKILQDIIQQNGLPYDATSRSIVINDQKISLSDVFSPRQLNSKALRDSIGVSNVTKLSNLRTGVVEAYLGKRSDIRERSRPRTPGETLTAKQSKLLFGVAGMYGNPFPPTLLELGQADGLKNSVSATVFGSVLNKDKIAKQAKIDRIKNINEKRIARGKSAIVDEAGIINMMAAPTAKSLSSKLGVKQAIGGVSRANKQLAIDTVTAIAKTLDPSGGGSRIFLDFDKTLAYGSDKIGPKINKKNPDYSAFGDPRQIVSGLSQAKLTGLGLRLRKLVTTLDSKSPGLGNELLRKMFVVSARPQKTIPLIARWVRNQGLRIPPGNFTGVGGSGISPSGVAVAKAEKIVGLGGAGGGSVFIDDDPRNISATNKAGITSIQYGAKLDRKTRREAAQAEGLAYQDYIRKNLPANILKAMETEGQSIDFPMGLGSRIATGWFNDPRLSDIPVDTKRTLDGPRGKIKNNIINYLRGKGYSLGGLVQKFANGGSAEDTVPALLTPGEFVINKKAAKRIGAAQLHRLNKADKIQGFNKGGGVGFTATSSVADSANQKLIKTSADMEAAIQKIMMKLEKFGDQVQKETYQRARSVGGSASASLNDARKASRQQVADMANTMARVASPQQKSLVLEASARVQAQQMQKAAGSAQSIAASSQKAQGFFTTIKSTASDVASKTSSVFKNMLSIGKSSQSMGLGSGGTSLRQQVMALRDQGLSRQERRDQISGGGIKNRLQNAAFGLSFAIPMIADMFTTAEPKNAKQAATNAQMQGISTAIGSATMLASMGAPGMLAAIPVAIGGVIKAFADAENAANSFNKQLQADKLEESLENAGKALDNYSNNIKDTASAEKARAAVLKANREASSLSAMNRIPQASMVGNIVKALGVSPKDNMAFERSQILQQKGLMSYLGSIGFGGGDASATTSIAFRSLIPELAKENAKSFQGASEASARFLENQFKSGQTVESLSASGDLQSFGRSLALADVKVQEYIMSIDNTVGLSDAQKNAMKENIIATQTEAKAREIQTRALREKSLETLNRQTTQLQNSLERMFQNMEQAINSNSYSLTKLSDNAELAAASLSGAARAGTVRLDAINAINNPRGVTNQQRNTAVSQAASMFGSQASEMEGVLKLGGQLENVLMSTINNTIKAANATGTAMTQEAIGAKLETSINQALVDLKIPPELATGLSREVKDAVQKMRTSQDDDLDFSSIINEVPQLSRVLESSRRAQELANKALENWQQNLNEYASAMNSLVDTQVEINDRLRRSSDILINGQLQLGKALGQNVSLQRSRDITLERTASRTGGLTDPLAIGNQIRSLERLRTSQEANAQSAAQQGFSGKDQFVNMQQNLANTNLALRENYAALKDMADNTEIAGAALERISEIRQRTQAGVNIAERLVTSSPQELADLNRSMALLNNNMRGGMNIGSTAEDRKGVLDVFNMIAPFLGEGQDSIKANVLESMLRESGIGVNNMMQGVLDSLRNPAADPQMAQAIAIYNQGVGLQAKANEELAKIAAAMSANTADIAAQKIAQSIQGVTLKFETQTLSDINMGIQQLVDIAKSRGPVAAGLSSGGVVYAADGQYLNFQSKGTDTVPAMLTPGEFVVNRKATQKNLPLLKSINNGYQNGGRVSYYQDGGLVFGGRWGLRRNRNAQGFLEAGPDLESVDKLTGLNWNELLDLRSGQVKPKSIPKNSTVGAVNGLVGYAGGSPSKVLLKNEEIKAGSSGSLGGSLPLYPAMFAYDKIMIRAIKSYRAGRGAGAGTEEEKQVGIEGDNLNIIPREVASSTILDTLNIPDLSFIEKALSTPTTVSFSDRNKTSLLEAIQILQKNIPDITDGGRSLTIGNKDILTDFSEKFASLTPRYSVKDNTNYLDIVIDNIGKSKYWDQDILISDRSLLNQASRGAHKSLTGIQYPVGAGVKNWYGKQYLSASTGPSSALVAGGFANLGIGQDLWPIYDSSFAPIKLDALSSLTSGDKKQQILKIKEFKAALDQAQNTVRNTTFKESGLSSQIKYMINKMRNLVRGSSFKEIFNADEINSGGKPVTLFNLTKDIWSTLTPQFTNSPRGTYATNDMNSWVPIDLFDSMTGTYTSLGKVFPWITEGFADTDIIMQRKAEFIEKVGDLVKIQAKEFKNNFMSFPYKTVTGPLWQNGTFTNTPFSFNIIDDVTGDLNPFKGFNLNPSTEAIVASTPLGYTDIDSFVRELMTSYSRTGKFNPTIGLRLNENDLALSKTDYTDNTKAHAFYNLAARRSEFDPVAFRENLDKEREKQRIEQRDQMAGRAVGQVQGEIRGFDSAKRVALGRLVYKAARENRIPIRGRPPEQISQLGMVSEMLQQMIQSSPSDYTRTLLSGTKFIFDRLRDPSEDGSFFVENGIDIRNAFDPDSALRKNIRLPDGTIARNAIYDYKNVRIPTASIFNLIRSSGLKSRFDLGQVVQDTDMMGLSLKGTKLYSVDIDGNLVEKPFDEATKQLKWGQLYEAAFNPYSRLQDATVRQSLFSLFSEKINNATVPGTRRPFFDKRLLSWMNTAIGNLSQWYKYQDYFINTGDSVDISRQKQPLLPGYKSRIDTSRPYAQASSQFFTNNEFGALPTFEWISSKLDQMINPAQQMNAVGKSRGGVVYASNGAFIDFKPRGTDTVPAMLTPGEFVVNRQATQKHLPLLKTLNMNRGGKVQYRQRGGNISYDPSTGSFARSESLTEKVLSAVQNNSKLTESNHTATTSNLSVSRSTNIYARNTDDKVTKLQKSVKNATGFASGGLIYANKGTLINFQPKGSDTVPAMLTPGEFVVNRQATQKHLSLLQAINNNNFANDSAITLNKGGYIQPAYLRNGGFGIPGIGTLPDFVSQLSRGIKSAIEKAFNDVIQNLEQQSSPTSGVSNNSYNKDIANKIGSFTQSISVLADKLESISVPPEITIQGRQDINVNANGLQILSSLNPSIANLATKMIKSAIDSLAQKNPGTLDFNIEYPQGS